MAVTITDGVAAASSSGARTLAELVARWRLRLDDNSSPYLWSNQELTDYMNVCINSLCREIPIIEDATTASICQVAVSIGSEILSISDRIVWLKRAKLDSDTRPLSFASVDYMDQNIDDWEDAAGADVQYLITDGVGTDKVRIYPPSLVTDTLRLSVVRLPLADMVYASDSASVPEIPSKYQDLLDNGVMYYAYLKQDTDTMDMKKADYHLGLWKKNLEEIKRSMVKYAHREHVVAPHTAFS